MSYSRSHYVSKNNSDIRNPKIDDDTEKRAMLMISALLIIKDMQGRRGKITCPKCGNDLYWTRASINGHV